MASVHGQPLNFTPRLLGDMFDATATRFADRPAVDFLGRVTRYGELARLVERATRGLQDLGVVPGTRVALCLPNLIHYPVLYLATLKAGGIVVNVNPLYVDRELQHLLTDSGAEVIVTCDLPEIHDRVSRIAAVTGVRHVVTCSVSSGLPLAKRLAYRLFKRADVARVPADARHLRFELLIAAKGAPAPASRSPDDVAVLQYTGGTHRRAQGGDALSRQPRGQCGRDGGARRGRAR